MSKQRPWLAKLTMANVTVVAGKAIGHGITCRRILVVTEVGNCREVAKSG
jgi:hypothetical protein